jgi:signal transduction histidine kinase
LKHLAPINACRRAVLLFIIFLCTLFCHAQTKSVDSILVFIEGHKQDDTLKVKAFLQLSDLLQTINLPKALNYAIQANNIADKIGNDYYVGLSKSRLASVQTWLGKTNEALALYLDEVAIAKRTASNRLLQNAYDGIAYVYETENEWDLSLQYGLKSLSIAEKSPSPYDMAYSYHQLGSVYLGMGGYLKAELYLKKAKVIFINNANVERTAICNVDLAKVYMNLHYYNLAKTYLDSAVQLFSSIQQPIQVAEAYQQLGKLALKQEIFSDAEGYYNHALDIYKNSSSADLDYAHAMLGLGEVALGRKDYPTALQILKADLERLKAAHDDEKGLECLLYIASADSAAGNFKEANDYLQQYRVVYNTFYDEKKNKAAQRMLIEFDVERQNSENKILKTKYAEEENRLVIILSAAGLILLGTLFLIVLYRQKNAAFKAIEKLQEETAEKNKEMLLANNVKDKLISMIAHDVRSPLASVQNTLTLTREEVISLEDFARLSQMLEMDIQHLTGMLDNTLMWAREQMIDISIKKVNFNIYTIIDDVIAMYQQTITSKGIMVYNHIKPNTEVFSDKDIIATVLRNIVSNAIKFTPQGKSIYIEQTNIKSKVLISVKDEGVGISDEVLKKINDKQFISTRGTDNEKGTGLGLLFSRDLLLKLGEDFQISSVRGKGTAVTISVNAKK